MSGKIDSCEDISVLLALYNKARYSNLEITKGELEVAAKTILK